MAGPDLKALPAFRQENRQAEANRAAAVETPWGPLPGRYHRRGQEHQSQQGVHCVRDENG